MSQYDVLKWFKKQKDCGIEESFTVKQVHKHLNDENINLSCVSVWNSITKLKEGGFLEISGYWPIRFKAKCGNPNIDKKHIKA